MARGSNGWGEQGKNPEPGSTSGDFLMEPPSPFPDDDQDPLAPSLTLPDPQPASTQPPPVSAQPTPRPARTAQPDPQQPGPVHRRQRPRDPLARKTVRVLIGVALVFLLPLGIAMKALWEDLSEPSRAPLSGPTDVRPNATWEVAEPPAARSYPTPTEAIPRAWTFQGADMTASTRGISGTRLAQDSAYVTENLVIGRLVSDPEQERGPSRIVALEADSGALAWSFDLDDVRCAPPVEFFGGVPELARVCSGRVAETSVVRVIDVATGTTRSEWSVAMPTVAFVYATPAALVLLGEADPSTGAASLSWFSSDGTQGWNVPLESLVPVGDYTTAGVGGLAHLHDVQFTRLSSQQIVLTLGSKALLLTPDLPQGVEDCVQVEVTAGQIICEFRNTVSQLDGQGTPVWSQLRVRLLDSKTHGSSILVAAVDYSLDATRVIGLDPITGDPVGLALELEHSESVIGLESAGLGIATDGEILGAFDPELLWAIRLPSCDVSQAVLVGDSLVVNCGPQGVLVLNAAAGELEAVWTATDPLALAWNDQVVSVGSSGISMLMPLAAAG